MGSAGPRSIAAIAVILCAAFLAFFDATAGFTALTSDGIRRVELARSPRTLPALELIDEAGQPFRLSDYGVPSSHATFIALVYVRCQSVCRTSGSAQSWLQDAIHRYGLEDRVRLLTLSFDPARDAPAVLRESARQLAADRQVWRFATLRKPQDVVALLKLFDVVVLPDEIGGYSHNAALFVVDRSGRLVRAYDIDRPDLALADYLRWAGA